MTPRNSLGRLVCMLVAAVVVALPARAQFGKIAFSTVRDGNREIYVMNDDGTGQLNVSLSSSYESSPAISPDGKEIAFVSNRTGFAELFTMKIDGSDIRQLTNLNVPGAINGVDWHPDGARIVFAALGGTRLYEIASDGSWLGQLSNDTGLRAFHPRYSLDGQSLYTQQRPGSAFGPDEIYRSDTHGTGMTRITFVGETQLPCEIVDHGVVRLQYARGFQPSSQIYIAELDGLSPINVSSNTHDEYYGHAPRGLDGVLAYSSDRDSTGVLNIWRMRSDGTGATQLTTSGGEEPFWWVPEKVTICHRTEGRPEAITLTVSANAASAHLAHGDTLGRCPQGLREALPMPSKDGGYSQISQ